MSSSLRSSRVLAAARRPAGPRCHGGASSVLRLGLSALPPSIATARASAWRAVGDDADATVEHVVRAPRPASRPAPLWS
jgi:hypothetical protein